MAKIIELCGPPGVGKSTIYQKIKGRRKNYYNWIPVEYVYPRKEVTVTTILSTYLTWRGKRIGEIDKQQMARAGERFIEQNEYFIKTCTRSLRANAGNYDDEFRYLYRKLRILYSLFQKVQIALEADIDKYVVLDEGLVKYLGNGVPEKVNTSLHEKYQELVELIPLPESVIHVKANPKTIVKRNYKRTKTLMTHESLTPEELEIVTENYLHHEKIQLDCVKKKGVNILHVDAENEKDANANKIINYLENI